MRLAGGKGFQAFVRPTLPAHVCFCGVCVKWWWERKLKGEMADAVTEQAHWSLNSTVSPDTLLIYRYVEYRYDGTCQTWPLCFVCPLRTGAPQRGWTTRLLSAATSSA